MFNYPGSLVSDIRYGANYALTDTSVTGSHNRKRSSAGLVGIQAEDHTAAVIFINDIRRTDKQQGIFGELSIDMSETSELTVGARWYDIEVDLEGSANSSFYTWYSAEHHNDTSKFGTNLSAKSMDRGNSGNPIDA